MTQRRRACPFLQLDARIPVFDRSANAGRPYRSGPTRRDRYAIRGSGTPWQCRVGREFAGIVRSIAFGLLQRVSKARARLRYPKFKDRNSAATHVCLCRRSSYPRALPLRPFASSRRLRRGSPGLFFRGFSWRCLPAWGLARSQSQAPSMTPRSIASSWRSTEPTSTRRASPTRQPRGLGASKSLAKTSASSFGHAGRRAPAPLARKRPRRRGQGCPRPERSGGERPARGRHLGASREVAREHRGRPLGARAPQRPSAFAPSRLGAAAWERQRPSRAPRCDASHQRRFRAAARGRRRCRPPAQRCGSRDDAAPRVGRVDPERLRARRAHRRRADFDEAASGRACPARRRRCAACRGDPRALFAPQSRTRRAGPRSAGVSLTVTSAFLRMSALSPWACTASALLLGHRRARDTLA